MTQTILITGAYGFIGSKIAHKYSGAGFRVVGIGHSAWKESEHLQYGLSTWLEGDVTLENLVKLNVCPDIIFHCAGSGSVGLSLTDPYQDYNKTVSATAAVLEYARLYSKGSKIVYPSSAAVYGVADRLPISESSPVHPISPYGVNKLIAETLCQSYARTFKLNVAIVRFFSVYGNGLKKQLLWDALHKINRNEFDFFGTGEEVRDWLHIDDAVLLMEKATEFTSIDCPIFNGGSGQGVKVKDILQELFLCMDNSSVPKFTGQKREGDPLGYVSDNRLVSTINWSPKTLLTEGLKSYVEWFKKVNA